MKRLVEADVVGRAAAAAVAIAQMAERAGRPAAVAAPPIPLAAAAAMAADEAAAAGAQRAADGAAPAAAQEPPQPPQRLSPADAPPDFDEQRSRVLGSIFEQIDRIEAEAADAHATRAAQEALGAEISRAGAGAEPSAAAETQTLEGHAPETVLERTGALRRALFRNYGPDGAGSPRVPQEPEPTAPRDEAPTASTQPVPPQQPPQQPPTPPPPPPQQQQQQQQPPTPQQLQQQWAQWQQQRAQQWAQQQWAQWQWIRQQQRAQWQQGARLQLWRQRGASLHDATRNVTDAQIFDAIADPRIAGHPPPSTPSQQPRQQLPQQPPQQSASLDPASLQGPASPDPDQSRKTRSFWARVEAPIYAREAQLAQAAALMRAQANAAFMGRYYQEMEMQRGLLVGQGSPPPGVATLPQGVAWEAGATRAQLAEQLAREHSVSDEVEDE